MRKSENRRMNGWSAAGRARWVGDTLRGRCVRLVALLGAALAVGCASDMNAWAPGGQSQTDLSKTHPETQETLTYIKQEARQHRVPQQYLSEARVGMSDVESKRDAARAAELERDAWYHEHVAAVTARRQDAVSNEQSALAEAEKIRREFDSQHSELAAKVAARERQTKAEVEASTAFRTSLSKERMSAQTDLISRAEHEFAQAQARIGELRTIREATEKEGLAAVDEMRETAGATRSRAAATVARLRTEAASTTEQTQARVGELSQQIQTVKERSVAESKRLLAQAVSLEQDSNAYANEVVARATKVEAQASQEEYDLKVTTAKSERQKSQAGYDRQIAASQMLYEKSLAEIERLRGDSNVTISSAESDFAKEMGTLGAWFKDSNADLEKIRAKSNRLERIARAEFVMSEAEARANAMGETAQHQEALAEAQMKTIIAEAQAEAARLRQEVLAELARKTRAGQVDFRGRTAPAPEEAADLHTVPEVPTVATVTPIVEPEHVAAFRTALAQVMRERTRTEAGEASLTVTYNENKKKLEAIKAQQLAIAAEQNASADAFGKKAEAEFAQRNARTGAQLAIAKSTYNRAIVEATAFRKEALAEATNLRALAKAHRDSGIAQAGAWRKESDVVARNGEAEAQALQAGLVATKERGHAVCNRLLAEADSIEQGEAALAAQIDASIEAAGQTLNAELVKLDRQVETSAVVAQADYEQSLVEAEVLGRKTDVEINRLTAQNELAQTLSLADIERARDELYVNQIKNEAEVERHVASAKAERQQTEAMCDAEQVAIKANADITTANATAQRQIASAQEEAIRVTFDSRVAQADSTRIRLATAEGQFEHVELYQVQAMLQPYGTPVTQERAVRKLMADPSILAALARDAVRISTLIDDRTRAILRRSLLEGNIPPPGE